MANIFVNLPIPAGDGPGAAIDVSAMGKEKSIVVGGAFPGATIAIEVSTDGGTIFQAIWLFAAAGKKVIPAAAQFIRVFVRGRSAAAFSANVDVGANDNGALFANLPVPAGDGTGAPVDVSALGNFTTFVAGGLLRGVAIAIEISEDGISYFPCGMSFADQGGIQSKVVVANFMRTLVQGRAGNTFPFTAAVSVGAINDAGSGAMDELVKVTAADTTSDFLADKIAPGSGIALNLLNPGADEQLQIEVDGADAGDIETGDPVTVRGDTNAEGGGTAMARAAHEHRLEYEVEDESVLVSARPRMDFVGGGVGVIDDVPGDKTVVTIPDPLGSGGAVLKRSLYKDDNVSTSSNSYVDGMSGGVVTVPIDGNYCAHYEGEGMNQNANGVVEIGISVNSILVVVANSERASNGNANDMRPLVTTVDLGALVAGDVVRMLIRKQSGAGSVEVDRRNLEIVKTQ
jgi:hypothetical protein